MRKIFQKKQNGKVHTPIQTPEKFKEKEEYISNAIHKLRTPLAIIKGNVDLVLLNKKELPGYLQDIFEGIDEEVKDVSSLLADLTILVRKDDNFARKATKRRLELSRIIEKVVDRFKPLLRTKEIKVNFTNKTKTYVMGDGKYVEKLFTNLINNAIKYNRKGGIITINFKKKGTNVSVSIRDNGFGIEENDVPFVFERFYRGRHTHSINGMGLGLAIVKSIAEAHNGSVGVKSEKGKGTTFTITFPLLQ